MKDRKLLNIELERISKEQYRSREESGLVVVLDNVRSCHNVGSAFRTCDAFGADHLHLCGITPVPPSAEIHKSGLGAEDSVPWSHTENTLDVVERLQGEGYTVLSVEQTVNSISLEKWIPRRTDGEGRPVRYALVFGNEVEGVSQDVVDASDHCLEIPQWGTKHSLNISVAVGVVLWHLREHLPL